MSNNVDFIRARDEELYSAYKECLRKKEVRSHQKAIEMAIKSPTSRFWISIFWTYKEILRLKRGKPIMHIRSDRKRMVEKIYDIYQSLEQRPEFRRSSPFFIVSFAIQQPAPEFYISYSRALTIISKMRNDEKRKSV